MKSEKNEEKNEVRKNKTREAAPSYPYAEPIVGAYYENWSQYFPSTGGRPVFMPNLIDPNIITDLYYAFALFGFITASFPEKGGPCLTGNFNVEPIEWNDQSTLYPMVQDLKKTNPKLRTILSIGGWTFNQPDDPRIGQYTYHLFSQMVSTKENRTNFIDSAIAYAQQWGFDGIDIDWEYPGDLTRGGTPEDYENFKTFLEECYSAFKAATPSLILTYDSPAATPKGCDIDPVSYFQWLGSLNPNLDRYNLMAYDYHGSWDTLTGANAPLYQDSLGSTEVDFCIQDTLDNYLNGGVPPEKIVLGMPIYGRSFGEVEGLTASDNGPGKPFSEPGNPGPSSAQAGLLTYYEITDSIEAGASVLGGDIPTSTAYAYSLKNKQWTSFDTPYTIALKAQFAMDNSLLGCTFFAIDNDEYWYKPKYPNVYTGYSHFYPYPPS